jgi:ABC-type multidrug transport system ATPase subunit
LSCTISSEQFDVQSAQLTVKETITFSAKMRLDRRDLAVTDISIKKFVHNIMRVLELLSIQDFMVGSGVGNGLSFEQKKRLSIAVEVASNPSILFLVR